MSLAAETLVLDTRPAGNALPKAAGHALALALVAAATLLALAVQIEARVPNLSLVFVLPVVIAAVSFGWGPAMVAAVAGTAAYNFFLIAPVHSFEVADPANLWGLGLLLAVAAITSAVAAQSRGRAVEARRAADHAMALQALARNLVAAPDRGAVAQSCAEALSRLFGAPAVVLTEADGTLEAVGGDAGLSDADREAADWSLASRMATRGGAYPVGEARYDFWPVRSAGRHGAVMGVALAGREQGRPADPERLVEIVGAYLAVALDREAYAGQLLEARVEIAGERLKADLLAAVSHDLRTPLSTIVFTLQSLRTFEDRHDAATRAELLALAETEAVRLSGFVENLLDMNRIGDGAVTPRIEAAAPAALVARALEQAALALAGRAVDNQVTAAAPALRVDAGLFESALAKVLENAGRYAPAGAAIRVRAGADGGAGWIEVEDEGPGFAGDTEALFERFARGVSGDGRPPGLGLGLPIARGFLAAMGGRIEALEPGRGAGARLRLSAPLDGDAA